MKGGLLGATVLTAGDVEALADVPPRDVLLARLAGGFQAPLVKAAGLFQAFTRNFAYGLKASSTSGRGRRGPGRRRSSRARAGEGRASSTADRRARRSARAEPAEAAADTETEEPQESD